MTDSTDYRLYLEEKFSGLATHINAQFNAVHDRLEAIEAQTTKTNGTVSEHAKIISANLPHSLVNCPQQDSVNEIKKFFIGEEAVERERQKDESERHNKIVRTVMMIGIAITIILSLLGSRSNKEDIMSLKNEVDMINTPVRTRGGTIQWYPSGVVIDSLKKMK